MSSEMSRVLGEDHNAVFFGAGGGGGRGKAKLRHYGPPKRRGLFTQRHGGTTNPKSGPVRILRFVVPVEHPISPNIRRGFLL